MEGLSVLLAGIPVVGALLWLVVMALDVADGSGDQGADGDLEGG